jgi:hypothetical protein
LEEMIRCGYDPRQALVIMESMDKQRIGDVSPTGILKELLDVHGMFSDRLSIMEQTLTALKNKHGVLPEPGEKIGFTDIDTQHRSHLKEYLKPYKTIKDKISALIDYVPHLQK